MEIRYPRITGNTTEEKLQQMEHYLRYLVQTLNILLRSR